MFLQIFVVTLCLCFMTCLSSNEPPPATFVFGDSLVDVGNNNYITTLAKADKPPNGIDFEEGRATGRFTNGKTVVDLIGEWLGVKRYIPPFLAPTTTGDVVLGGVNYASAASGILNATGYNFGGRINMDAQIDNFANTRQYIISRIGYGGAIELLSKALFSVTMGSNDFINNYLVPVASIPKQALVSPEDFVGKLMARYKLQLTRLYELGARKIVVANVGPLGCIPNQRDKNPLSGKDCVRFPNELANLFNSKLKILFDELNDNLDGSEFVYANSYRIVLDILQNYESHGFTNMNTACCNVPVGEHKGLVPCTVISTHCTDRSEYIFWDPYHPSEAANKIIAERFLYGESDDISPKNIRQLMGGY